MRKSVDVEKKDCYDNSTMQTRVAGFFEGIWKRIQQEIKWLTPGLGVKRWIVLILAGTTLIGLGFAVLILDIYRTTPDTWWLPILSTLSLRFLERPLRALIFGGAGLSFILFGTWKINRTLLSPFMRPGKPVLEAVSAFRRRERGPKIVVIGGGTGLSALLRGLKTFTNNLTAIVTVADDGGSSGELRRNMGVLPPGDIRNCLASLSNDEALLTQLFQYRFAAGAGLNGHTLGNLLITALTDITGSFEEAIAESGRVLAVQGQVLPATLHDVRLVADIQVPENISEIRVKGESKIPQATGHVRRIWLEPNNPLAFPPTVQAILSAELIIVGPGSLYTSIMPNLLVPDLAEAFKVSRAVKFYISNVATQIGETDGYVCGDHVHTIEQLLGGRVFDLLICNSRFEGNLSPGVDWVTVEQGLSAEYPIYFADLLDLSNPWRHDSAKLSQAVLNLFNERTGPLISKEG